MSDEFLSSVRNGIGSALISDENPDPILSEIARYAAVEGRGKLARPRLVQAFARAAGLDVDRTKTISVATELIHVASLLHDDIVDHAEQRRGMTAANRIWGNAATVLGGDFVLCRALIALQAHPVLSAQAIRVIEEMTAAAVAEVSARAEARMGNLFDPVLSRRVSVGKTAALFGWCGWAPAAAADLTNEPSDFNDIGRALGLAFQTIDDIHDFTVAADGDRPLSDLRTRNPNLVIALACEIDDRCAEQVRWLWAQDDLPDKSVLRVADTIRGSGAMQAAMAEADTALDTALGAVGAYAERDGFADILGWINWARQWKDEARRSFEETAHAAAV